MTKALRRHTHTLSLFLLSTQRPDVSVSCHTWEKYSRIRSVSTVTHQKSSKPRDMVLVRCSLLCTTLQEGHRAMAQEASLLLTVDQDSYGGRVAGQAACTTLVATSGQLPLELRFVSEAELWPPPIKSNTSCAPSTPSITIPSPTSHLVIPIPLTLLPSPATFLVVLLYL